MKAYSILVWFIFFNLVCGLIGTYVGSTEIGGKDIFGIADKPGVTLLPKENQEVMAQFMEITKSVQSIDSFGELLLNSVNVIILLPQLFLMMLLFIPNMLSSLQILPPEIAGLLNLGILFVTVIAIIQWVTNKWIGWAK